MMDKFLPITSSVGTLIQRKNERRRRWQVQAIQWKNHEHRKILDIDEKYENRSEETEGEHVEDSTVKRQSLNVHNSWKDR